MYTRKNPIKIGEGKKLLGFPGENSAYTHFSGRKSQYILIIPGGKMSIGEKMSIQHRSIKQSIKQQKRDKQNIVPRGNTG